MEVSALLKAFLGLLYKNDRQFLLHRPKIQSEGTSSPNYVYSNHTSEIYNGPAVRQNQINNLFVAWLLLNPL